MLIAHNVDSGPTHGGAQRVRRNASWSFLVVRQGDWNWMAAIHCIAAGCAEKVNARFGSITAVDNRLLWGSLIFQVQPQKQQPDSLVRSGLR
jgi:hypothetical protein